MKLIEPKSTAEFEKYFELRWKILRAPWGQPKGSEQDAKEDNSYHIMALHNDIVVGVARLEFTQQHSAQLRYMAVNESSRNTGIGSKILMHMEKYAKHNNAHKLILNARENALGFYEKLGYKVTEKSYVLFDSIQHYRMMKDL